MTVVRRSDRRERASRIVAGVMAVSAVAFGIVTLVVGVVVPAQVPHAFHNVIVASLLLVLSAPPVIQVARRPNSAHRAMGVLTIVGIAGLLTMTIAMTLDPFTLPFVILVGVLWALQFDRPRIPPTEPTSAPLLALVLLGSVPLVLYALGQADLQRTDHASEHAAFFHWVETSFYAIAVLFLGLIAALYPMAYRLAALCAGVALVIMGAASIVFDGYASALPMPWGWAALVGGVLFIGAEEWEVRRRSATSAFSTGSS